MFELVNEESPVEVPWMRTSIRVVVHGEPVPLGTALSDRGQSQVEDLARSRLITTANVIISSKEDVSLSTAKILSAELNAPIEKMSCIEEIRTLRPDHAKASQVAKFWQQPNKADAGMESLSSVKTRLRDCMNKIVERYRGGMVVVVLSPALALIFLHLVDGGTPTLREWLDMGFASCSTFEYSKRGWHIVMPPENSFQTEPSTVQDWLPQEWRTEFELQK